MKLRHICEICGREEVLDSDEAFELGWDYPPRSCSFGTVAARTCPNCTIEKTVWWALAMEGNSVQDLDDKQIKTLLRIMMEPESIMPPKSMGGL
ncbi:hypothetical protein OJ610_00895 [Streptococcus anginosus]|uniref:hypothetical protein n=1 Tax=Streptococcus anginosus TaxID=1328 RepID=UPI0021F84834|nr:hypothetical protein [Streptococcus anginosus]MCW1051414.1 hypothetical protein [Streptococcus anginosus]